MIQHDIKVDDIVYFTEETFNRIKECFPERARFIDDNYGKPLKVINVADAGTEIYIEGYPDFFYPHRFIKKSYDIFNGQSDEFEI